MAIISRVATIGCIVLLALLAVVQCADSNGFFNGKNIILFISDQERATMHFPDGWEAENLPGLTRLKANGLSFDKCRTNACMCSAARATLLSGFMPAQHGVRYVLEDNMPREIYPQVELPTTLSGLAQAAMAAGYDTIYKGKMHLTKGSGANLSWTSQDATKYGWNRWDFPDAGGNQAICEGGGDTPNGSWPSGLCGNHDERFMNNDGNVAEGGEGAVAWLRKYGANANKPFFLVVSLINPHDVLFYPQSFNESNYTTDLLSGPIQLPATVNASMRAKPKCQTQFIAAINAVSNLPTDSDKLQYLNFYGSLLKKTDAYLVQLLDLLKDLNLISSTVVIRTADHGEMGMAQGGQRQKMFNFYEETLRVPMVYSNPLLWPSPVVSDALVSHVDFVPTIASLMGLPKSFATEAKWTGVDYSKVVAGEASSAQDYVVFTYDDYQWGQVFAVTVQPPNHIISVVEQQYKLAYYYDPLGKEKPEWEYYDYLNDPTESINLVQSNMTVDQKANLVRLQGKLNVIRKTRLMSLRLKYSVQLSGRICRNTTDKKFYGYVMGYPTGNSSIALDNPSVAGNAVWITADIGQIKGTFSNIKAGNTTSGSTTLTSTVQFQNSGSSGVFQGIVGKAILTLAYPKDLGQISACPSAPKPNVFCSIKKSNCNGVFKIYGAAQY